MSGGDQVTQADIEKLLQGAGQGKSSPAAGDAGQVAPPAQAATTPAGFSGQGKGEQSAGTLSQDDIEKLLAESGRANAANSQAKTSVPVKERSSQDEAQIHPADLDYLFRQAEQALASLEQENGSQLPPGVAPFEFAAFGGAPPSTQAATLDLLKEVELDVRIELGKTRMYLEDVLRLRKGAVVTLDKLAGDPVDIYVNGRLVARGEVLVLNDNFCIRVAELVAGKEPLVDRDV